MTNRRWVPPIAWAAVILLISSIPGSDLGVVAPLSFPGADKIVHATFYALLGWLGARAVGAQDLTLSAVAWTITSIAIFGAADEWHQQFVGRSPDPMDWVADTFGATAGVVLYAWRQRALTA